MQRGIACGAWWKQMTPVVRRSKFAAISNCIPEPRDSERRSTEGRPMIDGTKAVLAEPARLLGREFIPKWQHLNRRDRQGLSPGYHAACSPVLRCARGAGSTPALVSRRTLQCRWSKKTTVTRPSTHIHFVSLLAWIQGCRGAGGTL